MEETKFRLDAGARAWAESVSAVFRMTGMSFLEPDATLAEITGVREHMDKELDHALDLIVEAVREEKHEQSV